MKTTVKFIDANKNLVVVEVSTERGYYSICAEIAGSCGQCLGDAKPATEAQSNLIAFWNLRHLSAVCMEGTAELEDILNRLNTEEEERREAESERSAYDINQDDEDMISAIMEEKDCDRHDALCIIALARELGMEFSELDEVEGEGSQYRALGNYYYVDDADTLDDLARDRMKEDEDGYLECWIEQVKNQGERRGYNEWCDYVVDMDGWCSVLNHWDGRYNEQQVAGEWICVSRE